MRTSARDADAWTFRRDGQTSTVEIGGSFRSDAPSACNEAAANGLGIARAPLWQVRDHVDAGKLALVLEDYELAPMPIHLVWAPAAVPLRIRVLIDHLAGHLDLSRV